MKMAYAAWSKGTAALLLAIRDVARHYGVEEEWRLAAPELAERLARGRAFGSGEGLALGRARWRRSPTPLRRQANPRASTGPRPRSTARDRARGLAKRYGDRRVFTGVDLEVPAGGFLLVTGPNGSGKTTLLRVLAGLAAPTAGELMLPERHAIGYLGHEPLVYRELTPLENLTLFGRLYRVPERGERIGMLLERFGLWDARHDRVSTFSRGMQQRLGLCRVLLHSPPLLAARRAVQRARRRRAALLDGVFAEPAAPASSRRTIRQRVERLATARLEFA